MTLLPRLQIEHGDLCGCPKPDDCWGGGGWHCAESDGTEISQGGNPITKGEVFAYEKCPAFWRTRTHAHQEELVRRNLKTELFTL